MKTATLNGFEVCFPEIPEGATDVVFIGDNEKYPTVFFRHKDGFKYDMPAPTYPAEFVEWAAKQTDYVFDGEDWHLPGSACLLTNELYTEWKRIKEQGE